MAASTGSLGAKLFPGNESICFTARWRGARGKGGH